MKRLIQALVILVLLLLIAVLIKLWLNIDYIYIYINSFDKPIMFIDSVNRKIEYKRVGADGINYYFSMSDTFPTMPFNIRQFFNSDDYVPTFEGYRRYNPASSNIKNKGIENIPHISLFQGDPLHLHSLVSLENLSVMGDDSLMAVIGVVDVCGNTNNVFKATPSTVEISTTLYNDSTGGANYYFNKGGITFYRNRNTSYTLDNRRGENGQVLMMNSTADTAGWQYLFQNIEKTGLQTFKSVELAGKGNLSSGDGFILETTIDGIHVNILAFIP